jgi:hypothetical protein
MGNDSSTSWGSAQAGVVIKHHPITKAASEVLKLKELFLFIKSMVDNF